MKKITFNPGDRVGYAAKFLRNIGAFSGSTPQRRGVVVNGSDPISPDFVRVAWDDFEALAAEAKGQYADPEYVEDSRKHGQLVHRNNVAKVGSPRFVLNDL